MKTIHGAVLVALMMTVSGPAMAQDILMRRPIPNLDGSATPPGSVGNPGDSGPVVSPPTPTPNPSDSTPSSIPGGSVEPDPDLVIPGEQDEQPGTYQWATGPWMGSATCGQQSRITRQVGCQRLTPQFGIPGGGISMLPGDGKVMQASSDGAKGVLSNAIYDPSVSKAHMVKAQFGNPDIPMSVTDVDISFCQGVAGEIGAQPINTYVGTKAGCDYTPIQKGYTDWKLPDGADGTTTCSSAAYRQPIMACTASDGNEVPFSYCLENLQSNGTRNTQLGQPEYGNTESCTYRWYGSGYFDHCDGNAAIAGYDYSCVRSDGTTLQGDAASACGEMPATSGTNRYGDCYKQFFAGGTATCLSEGHNPVVRMVLKDPLSFSTVGSGACVEAGATCCSLRLSLSNNYSGARYGEYEVIGTTDVPYDGQSFFFDDSGMAIEKDREQPSFRSYGGSAAYYSPYTYDIPPRDTGTGAPPNGNVIGGGGGGPPIG